jgi:RNA polymerase sigma-70 factor (ECF subfamily)
MLASERVRREQKLVRAVLAGDESAWRALYDGAYAGLWNYVVWRCAGLADVADEVTQETWLVAVRRIGAFDPVRASFLTWLRGIAAKVLQHHFRAKARHDPQSLSGNEAAPDHETLREQAELIARALAELPERYEAALRAKYLDLMSVEEIAKEWNETPKAIESLLTRSRECFRATYEKLAGHDVMIKETKP